MSQKIYTDRTDLEGVELPSAGQTRFLVVDENKKIKTEVNELTADQVSYDNTDSGLLAETVQEAVDELATQIGELEDSSGDFIPLAGTEVGKPLTGNIEVDTTNERLGFYSDNNNRFIGLTDDGLNAIISSDSSGNSYLEQAPEHNHLNTQNNNSQTSNILTYPDRILLNNTDNEGGRGFSGELSINNFEFRFDSKTDHGTEFDGSLRYNAEEGLFVQNNDNGDYGKLSENGLEGFFNNRVYSLVKNPADSNPSYLLFPDSGATQRRIPVSVNGNFANQQGDIELTAYQVSYDNTDSGLDAINVQEAVDEVQSNVEQEVTDRKFAIETAGFAPLTGTTIAFDKWATYNSYDSPSSGNFSYDLTNPVIGMIQVAYHESSFPPTFTQAGITVMVTGEYQSDVVNRIAFELIALDRILINIKPL